MTSTPFRAMWLALLLLTIVSCSGAGCSTIKSELVRLFTPEYKAEGDPSLLQPVFTDADVKRPRIAVHLQPVATGVQNPTDIQFVPGFPGMMVVLEKEGRAQWFAASETDGSQKRGPWFKIAVVSDSEEGLLGLAFHPRFRENGRFFLHYNVRGNGTDVSRVAEWQASLADITAEPSETRLIISVDQPYANHNGGQIAFGPDGYLYIAWGDGGWKNDPHENGQNGGTWLGKVLRIDVDRREAKKAYAIPEDNPFVGQSKYRPEIYALGLRNPWRFSFDSMARLWVADVGQDLWEEVDIVTPGANLGWNTREGTHCFEAATCSHEGLTDPVYEYGRTEGQSITGGYVYEGDAIPALRGKYVFGDFLSGRLWALDPPAGEKPAAVHALGKWPLLVSTFGRDEAGTLYLGDFMQGKIYRLEAAR